MEFYDFLERRLKSTLLTVLGIVILGIVKLGIVILGIVKLGIVILGIVKKGILFFASIY